MVQKEGVSIYTSYNVSQLRLCNRPLRVYRRPGVGPSSGVEDPEFWGLRKSVVPGLKVGQVEASRTSPLTKLGVDCLSLYLRTPSRP